MRVRFTFFPAMILAVLVGHAETLDRIAVTVGNQVIAKSDVIADLRVAALLDQKPVDLSGEQKRQAAARLVDQTLILKEAEFSRAALPSAEDAARVLEQVKSQYSTETDYQRALKHYQVTEEDVVNHLLAGLRALRFTDLRFRPEIETTPEEVRQFYDQKVLEWRRTNADQVPSFEAGYDEMERLLIDQRVTQALDRWLSIQRNQTEIVYREPAFK